MLYADLFNSKAIAMFAYDVDASRLLIHFKTGGVYAYQGVPRTVFDGFREARSKGQFFQSAIRDRFAGRRLSPGEVAAVEHRHSPGAARIAEAVPVDISSLERPSKESVFF